MPLDLILRQARLADGGQALCDIGVAGGPIAALAEGIAAEAPGIALDGRLGLPGFGETHIHLDKSCLFVLSPNPKGTSAERTRGVGGAKRGFTEADVYARAQRTLEQAIVNGTTRMRTHVEVDPRIGLKGFEAMRALARDYDWAIDLQICAFPQEGLTNDPGTEGLLIEA